MNDPKANDLEQLINRALQGKLSGEEKQRFEERLSQDAALRARFAEEQALERLLDRAPKLPVPTNFTSLVLQAVRKKAPIASTPSAGWFRFTFARIATGLAVVVAAGFFAVQQYLQAEREQMARSVSAFTEVAAAINMKATPPTTVFQDFEAIQQLSLPHESELDLELLVFLQK